MILHVLYILLRTPKCMLNMSYILESAGNSELLFPKCSLALLRVWYIQTRYTVMCKVVVVPSLLRVLTVLTLFLLHMYYNLPNPNAKILVIISTNFPYTCIQSTTYIPKIKTDAIIYSFCHNETKPYCILTNNNISDWFYSQAFSAVIQRIHMKYI